VEAHKCSKNITRKSQPKAHMIEMVRKLSFMIETAKMPSEKAKMHSEKGKMCLIEEDKRDTDKHELLGMPKS
jgi:hypothetical protein